MPVASEFVLYRPREMGDVLSDTFRFLKLAAPTLASIVLRVILPLSIVGAFLGDVARQFEPDYASATIGLTLWEDLAVFMGLTFVSTAFLTILSAYFSAFVFATLELYDGEGGLGDVDQQELRARAHRSFWPLVRASLLLYIGLVALGLLAIIPCLGWVAAPVLIVLLAVRCSLAPAIVGLCADAGAAEAFRRSFRLTKDSFWQTAGVVVIAYVLGVGLAYGFAFGPTLAATVALQLSGYPWGDTFAQEVIERIFFALSGCFGMISVVVVSLALGIQYAQLSEGRNLTAFWRSVDARRSALDLPPAQAPTVS